MRRSKGIVIGFWIATVLLCLQMGFTAYAQLCLPQVAEAFTHLGFPAYFRVELSWAKILGVVLLLAPVPARLKEWAYAGFTFEALAAILSLASTGNTLQVVAVPWAFLVLQLISYSSWTHIEGRAEARGKARRRVRTPLPASASAMRGYY